MTLQNKGTYKDKVTLYTKRKDIVKKASEILKREGSSLSEFFNDQIAEYVRLHEKGNPQQRIDVILFDKKAYEAPKFCGVRGCNGQATGFGLYQGKRYALCKAHFELFADSPAWQIVKE